MCQIDLVPKQIFYFLVVQTPDGSAEQIFSVFIGSCVAFWLCWHWDHGRCANQWLSITIVYWEPLFHTLFGVWTGPQTIFLPPTKSFEWVTGLGPLLTALPSRSKSVVLPRLLWSPLLPARPSRSKKIALPGVGAFQASLELSFTKWLALFHH